MKNSIEIWQDAFADQFDSAILDEALKRGFRTPPRLLVDAIYGKAFSYLYSASGNAWTNAQLRRWVASAAKEYDYELSEFHKSRRRRT